MVFLGGFVFWVVFVCLVLVGVFCLFLVVFGFVFFVCFILFFSLGSAAIQSFNFASVKLTWLFLLLNGSALFLAYKQENLSLTSGFYLHWQLSAWANVIVNPKGTAEFYTSKWSVTFKGVKREQHIFIIQHILHSENGEKWFLKKCFH